MANGKEFGAVIVPDISTLLKVEVLVPDIVVLPAKFIVP